MRGADVEITLVDRRNFHLFQPLAYQVATGALSPGESSLGRPAAHGPARTPRPSVYPAGAGDSASTLELVKRAHVIRVLEETNWIVGGPRGAAARLGMKRTTLQSYMKRLAIAHRV